MPPQNGQESARYKNIELVGTASFPNATDGIALCAAAYPSHRHVTSGVMQSCPDSNTPFIQTSFDHGQLSFRIKETIEHLVSSL